MTLDPGQPRQQAPQCTRVPATQTNALKEARIMSLSCRRPRRSESLRARSASARNTTATREASWNAQASTVSSISLHRNPTTQAKALKQRREFMRRLGAAALAAEGSGIVPRPVRFASELQRAREVGW